MDDNFMAPRQIARRADGFALPRDAPSQVVIDFFYASGRTEGPLRLLAEQGRHLDGTALLLLDALTTLATDPENVFWGESQDGSVRRYIRATAYTIAQLALSRQPTGRDYRELGISRSSDDIGALQALASVLIESRSVLLGPNGRKYEVGEGYHIVDRYRWWQFEGEDQKTLLVALDPSVWAAIESGAMVVIPPGIRALGSRNAAALRLAHFVLSHSPLPAGKTRRGKVRRGKAIAIGASSVATVLGWGEALRSPKYRKRYISRLRDLVSMLDRVDTSHRWKLIRATGRAWGWKVVVYPRPKSGR